jgi:hypothetical protein
MIFGFNTDIKHEGTVYHVQSEARQHDLLLQTQIFVRGRCIGKHATSYADRVTEPGFSDEHMHDLLKSQHKEIIEAIRNGGLNELLGTQPESGEPAKAGSGAGDAAISTPAASALVVEWLNADTVYEQNTIVMKFAVRNGKQQVSGAQLTSRITTAADRPIYSQAVTDSDGTAELRVIVDESELADASVLVQATHEGSQATRKFRLRRGA